MSRKSSSKADKKADGKMNIVYMPIDDIIPYKNNARRNEEAVPVVKASIEQFGFAEPSLLLWVSFHFVARNELYPIRIHLGNRLGKSLWILFSDYNIEVVSCQVFVDNFA